MARPLEHGELVQVRQLADGAALVALFDRYESGRYVRVLVQDDDDTWRPLCFDIGRVHELPDATEA